MPPVAYSATSKRKPNHARPATNVARLVRAALSAASIFALGWTLREATSGAGAAPAIFAAPSMFSSPPATAKAVVAMLQGDNVEFSAPPGLTLREAEAFASNNMGNLVWRHAARRLFDSETTDIIFVNSSNMPWNVPKNCQLLFLPVANLIQECAKFALDPSPYSNVLTRWVRDAGVRVAVVGLGLQAPFKLRTIQPPDVFARDFQLHEDQVAFFTQLAANSSILTVRGAHTQAVAEHNGNSQAAPLGCPTLFVNHDLALGKSIQEKLEAVVRERNYDIRVAVTLPWLPSRNAKTAKEAMAETSKLLRWLTHAVFLKFPNSFVVLQSNGDYGTLEFLRQAAGFRLPAQRLQFFYDVPAWISAMEACDVALHFRIHGMMATIAAGTPSVIISTDYRVEELAEVMRLPRADIFHRHFEASDPDMFEFLAALPAPFIGSEFDANRARIARQYITLFQGAGVSMHQGIRRLADGA